MTFCEFCRKPTSGTILIYGRGDISICGSSKCKAKAVEAYK